MGGRYLVTRPRKAGARAVPPAWIVAIDPGNDSAGICIVNRDKTIWDHATVSPWDNGQAAWQGLIPTAILHERVFIETPSHGAHGSRAGVNFAAGMILAQYMSVFGPVKRKDVVKVPVNTWRKSYPELRGRQMREELKEKAMSLAIDTLQNHGQVESCYEISSDDEAEAILLANYGWEQVYGGRQ
jgi:hypothetical protein